MNPHPLGWRNPTHLGRPHLGVSTAPHGFWTKDTPGILLGGLPVVYNQNKTQSCTAQALAAAVEILAPHAGYAPERPSRQSLYWRSRLAIRETHTDSGATLADGIYALRIGWEPETHYSNDWGSDWTETPAELPEDAPRVVNAEPLELSLETFAYELSTGSPIAIGLQITSDWIDFIDNTLPEPWGVSIGGHAVLLVGYSSNSDGSSFFRVRNSWGTAWAEDGYAWIPSSWLRPPWCGEAYALRAIRRAH